MKNRVHTVIFDLDGTLSDSGILTIAAFNKIAPIHGFTAPSREKIRRTTGYACPEFYHILLPDFEKSEAEMIGKMVEEEEARLLPSLAGGLLFEGCFELLHNLKNMEICLKIASTGGTRHVHSVLSKTGIMDLFDTVSCNRPDKTEMLREMIRDEDKAGHLMVGDMKKDYEAARANGIISVGACYGYCIKELSEFDHYIDRPHDLLKIMQGM